MSDLATTLVNEPMFWAVLVCFCAYNVIFTSTKEHSRTLFRAFNLFGAIFNAILVGFTLHP